MNLICGDEVYKRPRWCALSTEAFVAGTRALYFETKLIGSIFHRHSSLFVLWEGFIFVSEACAWCR